MKGIFVFLFITLLITACAPQTTETPTPEPIPTQTSEFSENSEVLPPSESALTTEASSVPTTTLAVDVTESIATLVGTKAAYIINFTSPTSLSCSTYMVVDQPTFYTTNPTTCLPDVPANNTLWGSAIQNLPLRVGTPVAFLDSLALTPASGVANSAGFGITPDASYQGLQYMILNLGPENIIVWANVTAPQQIITAPGVTLDANGNPVEPPGGGGGTCDPPNVFDPVSGGCNPPGGDT